VRTVRLGAIAKSLPCNYGDEPKDDAPTFDVVKVSNVNGEGQFHGEFEKRRFDDHQIANLLVREGELLVVKSSGSKANILSGKTAMCGADQADRIVASNFLLRLRVDESAAVPRFIWYVLNSGPSKAFVKTIVGASTYPNLKWSSYASHPIPLPPLPEQRRIAGILDKADVLRAKRRTALAQLDVLLRSTFLDMFGDPVTNPMGWERRELDYMCSFLSGYAWKAKSFNSEGLGSPIIRIQNVGTESSDLVHTTEKPIDRFWIAQGEYLLSLSGSFRLAAWNGPRALLNQRIVKLTPESFVAPAYFEAALSTQLLAIEAMGRHALVNNVALSDLKKIELCVPPLDLQNRFAAIAASVEQQKARQHAHLAELDTLFASLQSRAFRGEL